MIGLNAFGSGYGYSAQNAELYGAPGYFATIRDEKFVDPAAKREALDLAQGIPRALWPARHQGLRGTCTAFAISACVELMRKSGQGQVPALSPEYLYWHMRAGITEAEANGLPQYDLGAARLGHAVAVLQTRGLCPEDDMRYRQRPDQLINGLFSAEAPSPEAETAAQAGPKFTAAAHQDFLGAPPDPGLSNALLDELRAERPVALGLAVFRMGSGNRSNWTYSGARNSGLVADPDLAGTSFELDARRSGHVVCVTGFQPGPERVGGGWFIFRNSWGGGFGRYPGPGTADFPAIGRRGFGAISINYVQAYTIEYLSLQATA